MRLFIGTKVPSIQTADIRLHWVFILNQELLQDFIVDSDAGMQASLAK